uniref:RILP-like protein 1 n=1 Tax=Syphacia muris TaxID=451379 RepID=A0A0N5B1I1_9BILA
MSLASPTNSPSRHITVVDVYDLAASVGKDFEKLIDQFGDESVISALETLEALANKNERENDEILTLRQTVERLENEKHAKNQDRIKFEMELEAVEENYRKEIDDLWKMVKSLQAENRQLSCSVKESTSGVLLAAPRDEDLAVMIELKELSNKQKAQIKDLQKDVESYSCEAENLHNNIKKLIRQNEELLRKNASLQKQGRMLVEEKSEIIRRLQNAEESNFKLAKMFKDATRQCKDLQEIKFEESDNSPHFSVAELREVLQEKNMLKGRVMELEEELEQLRPRSSGLMSDVADDSFHSSQSLRKTEDDEYVVYGPINKEPDEKLFPWKYERRDSGVRRFFRFFKEGLNGGSRSPRRGSSNSPIMSRPIPSRSSPLLIHRT